MSTQEELLRYKKSVDFLSEEAKKSRISLMDLCNEISFAKNLNLVENSASEADRLEDNLIYILSERIIDHLTHTHSLLSVYEEYSKMLERLIPPPKMEEELE